MADCTGHGVPGALMSMMGNELSNSLLGNGAPKKPGDVLLQADAHMRFALNKRGNENADGMDIAIFAWDAAKKTVQYAGANRPIWIIRKGSKEEKQQRATQGDRTSM